jgi:hypothetical protein
LPDTAFAIQIHQGKEGILVHQLGHLLFLLSMVGVIFTINTRELSLQKGWRLIRYAALFFVLWNINTLTAHFLDNQINVVRMEIFSLSEMAIITQSDSQLLSLIYYLLKLDHIWCVPAMVLLLLGLNRLLQDQIKLRKQKDSRL